jgi:hypothetical protein
MVLFNSKSNSSASFSSIITDFDSGSRDERAMEAAGVWTHGFFVRRHIELEHERSSLACMSMDNSASCLVQYRSYSPMRLETAKLEYAGENVQVYPWTKYEESDLLSLTGLDSSKGEAITPALAHGKSAVLSYICTSSSLTTWILGFTLGKRTMISSLAKQGSLDLLIPNHWVLYDPERSAWSDMILPEDFYQKSSDRAEVVGIVFINQDQFLLAWTLDLHVLSVPLVGTNGSNKKTLPVQEWVLQGRRENISFVEKIEDYLLCFGYMDGAFDLFSIDKTHASSLTLELRCINSTNSDIGSPVTNIRYITHQDSRVSFLFVFYEDVSRIALYKLEHLSRSEKIVGFIGWIKTLGDGSQSSFHDIILDGFLKPVEDPSKLVIPGLEDRRDPNLKLFELVFSILLQPIHASNKGKPSTKDPSSMHILNKNRFSDWFSRFFTSSILSFGSQGSESNNESTDVAFTQNQPGYLQIYHSWVMIYDRINDDKSSVVNSPLLFYSNNAPQASKPFFDMQISSRHLILLSHDTQSSSQVINQVPSEWIESWKDHFDSFLTIYDRWFSCLDMNHDVQSLSLTMQDALSISDWIVNRPFLHALVQDFFPPLLQETFYSWSDLLLFVERNAGVLSAGNDTQLLIYYYLLCSFGTLDKRSLFSDYFELAIEFVSLVEMLWLLDEAWLCMTEIQIQTETDHNRKLWKLEETRNEYLDRAWNILCPEHAETSQLPPMSPLIQNAIFQVFLQAQQHMKALFFARSRDIYTPDALISIWKRSYSHEETHQKILAHACLILRLILLTWRKFEFNSAVSHKQGIMNIHDAFSYYRQAIFILEQNQYIDVIDARKQMLSIIYDALLLFPSEVKVVESIPEDQTGGILLDIEKNSDNLRILTTIFEQRDYFLKYITLDSLELECLFEYCIVEHSTEQTHDFLLSYFLEKGKVMEALKFYPVSLCYPDNVYLSLFSKLIKEEKAKYIVERYKLRDRYMWTMKERLPTHYLKYLQDYYQKGLSLEKLEVLFKTEVPLSPWIKRATEKLQIQKKHATYSRFTRSHSSLSSDLSRDLDLKVDQAGFFASPTGDRVQVSRVQQKMAVSFDMPASPGLGKSKSMPVLPLYSTWANANTSNGRVDTNSNAGSIGDSSNVHTTVSPIPSSPRKALSFTPRTPSKLKLMAMLPSADEFNDQVLVPKIVISHDKEQEPIETTKQAITKNRLRKSKKVQDAFVEEYNIPVLSSPKRKSKNIVTTPRKSSRIQAKLSSELDESTNPADYEKGDKYHQSPITEPSPVRHSPRRHG